MLTAMLLLLVCGQVADPDIGNLACVPFIVTERATWGDTPGVPGTVNFQVSGYWVGTTVPSRCVLEKELPDGSWFAIANTDFAPPLFYVAMANYNFNVRVPKANSRYRLILRDAAGNIVGTTAYVLTVIF